LLEEKGVDLPMQPRNPIASLRGAWRGKGLVRASLLLLAAALIAAAASAFGIAHDYGYLHASILTGSPGGHYHALTMRLAERAKREHGTLIVVATAGSIENVNRLTSAARGGCAEKFALVQDGTPVPVNARLELRGRLPEPESLLLLGRPGHAFRSFADVRGASIGIGPEGSGTAYLMRQLFEDPDLQELEVHLSHYGLLEQAELVAQSKLDLAAFVIQEDAEFLRTIIRRHGLDIVSPQDLQGLIARSVAQSWPHSSRPLRRGAPAPGSGQTNCAPRNFGYRQSVRAASRPDRATHIAWGGAAGLRARQSSKFHKLRYRVAARTRGASILHYRRA
jgi:hypothetical protein